MNEWINIFPGGNSNTNLPSSSDADQFGHVIWFNPTTGTIVGKWNQPSMHYTHWRKTDAPDVIGDAFEVWLKKEYPGFSTDENYKTDRARLAFAFRAGAAAALK